MDHMDNGFDMEEELLFRQLLYTVSRPTIPCVPTCKKEIILHDCLAGNKRLMKDYFVEYPIYNNKMFERRFQMSNYVMIFKHMTVSGSLKV